MTCLLYDDFIFDIRSPFLSILVALGFTGRMTFLFWPRHSGLAAFTNCNPSSAKIFHLLRLALYYATLCSTGSFSIIFSLLLVFYSLTLLKFIALYPIR